MDLKSWKKIDDAFNKLYELRGESRRQYLEQLKQDDPGVFDGLTRMLETTGDEVGFMTDNMMNQVGKLFAEFGAEEAETANQNRINKVIGNYRLLKPIGFGGMGTVFLAERADGSFERKVAVKFVRSSSEFSDVMVRFKQEQRILGTLNHPAIASLYDAGVDEDGTPYLVMEYVHGTDLISYSKHQNLSIEQKLELFIQICSAVQSAHQNLVVHRDLKPSNVLVNRDGEPKLLDFGIAKLIHESEMDLTVQGGGAPFLTMKYAAPEQFKMEQITTQTDVYALGVLLYELICGDVPFCNKQSETLSGFEQAVCHQPAEKPSTRLVKTGTAPDAEVAVLRRKVKGDLDNIILKALEKEPGRRYSSAEAFASDIRRFLNSEVVEAVPASVVYVTSRYIKRNSTAVAIASVVFLSLLGGMIFHSTQMQKERNLSQLEAAKFEEMANFMINIFDYDGLDVPPQEATVTNLLEAGVERIDEALHDPAVKSEILRAIGKSYLHLGNATGGYELMQRAVKAAESLPENHPSGRGMAYYYLANAMVTVGDPEYMDMIKKSIEYIGREQGTRSEAYANALWLEGAVLQATRGYSDEVDQVFEEYLDIMLEHHQDNPEMMARAYFEYASYIQNRQDRIAGLHQAKEQFIASVGRYHQRTANAYNSLAYEHRNDEPEISIAHYHEALEIYLELYGEVHQRTVTVMSNLGRTYSIVGNLEKAEEFTRRSWLASSEMYDNSSSRVADALYWYTTVLWDARKYDKALPLIKDVVQVYRQNYAPGTRKPVLAQTLEGQLYRVTQQSERGLAVLAQTLEEAIERNGEDHREAEYVRTRMNELIN
ncbi:MAG: protein kinase [Balneolia bacterium]|nr:protein kinase [Balneolia bacterium]